MISSVDKECRRQLELAEWIDQRFKIKLPTNYREGVLAISCFDIAIEHHAAICLLCNAKLYGSMFALLRLVFESYVRGLWLRYCASSEELEQYKNEKININFDEMIKSVEKCLDIEPGPLSSVKKEGWKLMNSFTHSGYEHLRRRNADGMTGPINYDGDEICSVLNLAGTLSLLSAVELASYSGDSNLIGEALLKGEKYAKE